MFSVIIYLIKFIGFLYYKKIIYHYTYYFFSYYLSLVKNNTLLIIPILIHIFIITVFINHLHFCVISQNLVVLYHLLINLIFRLFKVYKNIYFNFLFLIKPSFLFFSIVLSHIIFILYFVCFLNF